MGFIERPRDIALLEAERDRAERRLNAVRSFLVVLLAVLAFVYGRNLKASLNLLNAAVLLPMLLWTVGQYLALYRRPQLPSWVATVNPVADITALTVAMAGYGILSGSSLALKSPLQLAYFAILAALPITASARKAAFVSGLLVVEYGILVAHFVHNGMVTMVAPTEAATMGSVSFLDEVVKLLLFAVGGAVATYATSWHEALALRYARQAAEREELRSRLMAAQLETLKLQLHPHFLFNALNVIVSLVHTDPRAAERMIFALSELVRVALYSAGDLEVPLERELDVLGHYLEIQRIRFEDQLTVAVDVPDELSSALVPNLLLQPLVENAVKHGIAPRGTGGHIQVQAERRGGDIMLAVIDDGVGLGGRSADEIVASVGLGNVRARLEHLYGKRHSLEIESPARGGFEVRITIPYHEGDRVSVPGVLAPLAAVS